MRSESEMPFHDVVRSPAELLSVLALGVHRVAGHDQARQVGDGLKQRLEAGDLVGLLTHVELGQNQAADVVHAASRWSWGPWPWPFRARSCRHHQTAQPTNGAGAPVGQPAAHRLVQRVTVDAANSRRTVVSAESDYVEALAP